MVRFLGSEQQRLPEANVTYDAKTWFLPTKNRFLLFTRLCENLKAQVKNVSNILAQTYQKDINTKLAFFIVQR